MTPYRERVQNGDYEPDTPPAQPKDIHYTRDQTTGRKVKTARELATATTTKAAKTETA